jgi:RNA recognition motif-containing protein
LHFLTGKKYIYLDVIKFYPPGEFSVAKKLYVGNLSHELNNEDLKEIFLPFGEVMSATIIIDRDTRRSKGFGFVEMKQAEEADAAIDALHGSEVKGRKLTVNEARPQPERTGSSGSRGGPRGNGNGGGRRY